MSSSQEWVQNTLSEILSSPHINFPKQTAIRMGHGPVDLFSTRFINSFTPDVRATVAGQEMTRDELKQSLLALQKHWNPNSVEFAPSGGNDLVATWTTKDFEQNHRIEAFANVVESGGRNKINEINLQGDPSLFGK